MPLPGAFKLDHLQPFKPILLSNVSNCFTFILGSPFLLPLTPNSPPFPVQSPLSSEAVMVAAKNERVRENNLSHSDEEQSVSQSSRSRTCQIVNKKLSTHKQHNR